jgi:hypothetical protein
MFAPKHASQMVLAVMSALGQREEQIGMASRRGDSWTHRGRAWNCPGGGKAHARTLFVLGYRCECESASFYKMVRGGVPIMVPKEPNLTQTVIRRIQAKSGHPRPEYVVAWDVKAKTRPKLNCPKA